MSNAARLQSIRKMEAFAAPVTIISKNGISNVRAARDGFVMAQGTEKTNTK